MQDHLNETHPAATPEGGSRARLAPGNPKLSREELAWRPILLPPVGCPIAKSDACLAAGLYSASEAGRLFSTLRGELCWEEREIRIFGRRMLQPRLVSYYGDPGASYCYSGELFHPRPWTATLDTVRRQVEILVGSSFNAVLCNLYRTGADSMGWHSDDEAELGERPVIASLSLGATRRLLFRSRDPEKREGSRGLDLQSGSLLVMAGSMQQLYQHQIPKVKASSGVEPRINLTFRKIIYPGSPQDFPDQRAGR